MSVGEFLDQIMGGGPELLPLGRAAALELDCATHPQSWGWLVRHMCAAMRAAVARAAVTGEYSADRISCDILQLMALGSIADRLEVGDATASESAIRVLLVLVAPALPALRLGTRVPYDEAARWVRQDCAHGRANEALQRRCMLPGRDWGCSPRFLLEPFIAATSLEP